MPALWFEKKSQNSGTQKSGTLLPTALCRGLRAVRVAGPSYHSHRLDADLRGLGQRRWRAWDGDRPSLSIPISQVRQERCSEGVTGASPLWRIQGGTPESVLLSPTLGNPLVVQWLRTQCSHCQGPRFNSWSGNLDPAGCIVADCPPPHPIKKKNKPYSTQILFPWGRWLNRRLQGT